MLATPHPLTYEDIVRRALLEDVGRGGDLTTDAVVAPGDGATASIVARRAGRVAGLEVARMAFRLLDGAVRFDVVTADGCDAGRGDTLAVVQGPARPILTGERTALNFLGRLSGIASVTRDVVALVAPHPARVVCTRKTTPGLRLLEKYAVRAGGGANHRFGLDDAVLVKDNHVVAAGDVGEAIRRVRRHVGHMVKVEVEVDTLAQLEVALREAVDAVLLDNMDVETLREAVRMVGGRALTEASGGITPQTAAAVAATGVDLMSIGWLTHSAPSLDVALDFSFKV
ncbi:MAG: carboxylating nicotinate-nucleotide diphosphorylase [Acidobacteriota bacterium]|jgi:nicotinate-nucleotide pyrophosphorylase (carboxylating)|nr:carboxylating nicotinate-nucleotide diphosphorylase [Acidobacteriota bacterium]